MFKKLLKQFKYQYALVRGKHNSEGFEHLQLRTYLKYALGGVFLFLIQLMIVMVLTETIGVKFLFAYAVALVFYVVLSFVYHNEFTFKKMLNVKREAFRKFLVYMGLSSSLTYLFVFILTNLFFWTYLPALFLVAFCMSILNFVVNAGWVF